jgi:hypothetical protein
MLHIARNIFGCTLFILSSAVTLHHHSNFQENVAEDALKYTPVYSVH